MNKEIKYTIIVPTRNSLQYLKDCIQSIISQDYTNYELIVSDNYSSDGTFEYVKDLKHPNIMLLRPDEPLSMIDHFEWCLSKANGEWIIFVGSDDGLQSYFFQLSDRLVEIANKKNIKAINSIRGYFFWKGCQKTYGDIAISYNAKAIYKIKKSKIEILNALLGVKNYIDLPQMYTESIIHKSLIKEVKEKQNGFFYVAQTPDACGAATICFIVNKYLESDIPLGWVGTSMKSNGFQYSNNREKYQKEYFKTMLSQRIKWNELMGAHNEDEGDKTIDKFKSYFYEAILQTEKLQNEKYKKIYKSKIFKTLLFTTLRKEIMKDTIKSKEQIENLKIICERNNIDYKDLFGFNSLLVFLIKCFFKILQLIDKVSFKQKIKYHKKHISNIDITLMDAYTEVAKLLKEKHFMEQFIKNIK